MNAYEDVFDKKPSDKSSVFYKNYSTISLFIIMLKEMKSTTFKTILSECSDTNIESKILEIEKVKSDSYKFNKTTKAITDLDYGSISKLYKKWNSYNNKDKQIILKCAIWDKTINAMDL